METLNWLLVNQNNKNDEYSEVYGKFKSFMPNKLKYNAYEKNQNKYIYDMTLIDLTYVITYRIDQDITDFNDKPLIAMYIFKGGDPDYYIINGIKKLTQINSQK